jgi:uncharacterized cupredoxin-like copper-binding protein
MFVRRAALRLLPVCLLLVVGTACGGKSALPGATWTANEGKVVQLTLSDTMTFDPPTVTLKTNEQVTFTLENDGAIKHNFSIDSLKVNQDVAPGATEHVTFTAPNKPGQLSYYCGVPGHKEAGMVGTLVVEQ